MSKKAQALTKPQTTMRMSQEVLRAIRGTVGSHHAETGGMLGGDPETGLISRFHFDQTAQRSGITYSPNVDELNRVLHDDWNPAGVRLLGFAHSHPRGSSRPSGGDRVYAGRILAAIPDLGRLYLPIVMSAADKGEFELIPYAASKEDGQLVIEPVELVLEESTDAGSQPFLRSRSDETFSRVVEAYDLDRLRHSRIVAVGCGGAAEFLELLARASVQEFILIDKDVVSVSNIATQQAYRRDVGRLKVEAIAERIHDINPEAIVKPLWLSSDELSDSDFHGLLTRRIILDSAPEVTLLCGMTDSFHAQARVNRLALQYGVPSLCAQVYAQGRGAEVTFTHPETTPACHRCVLRSRYEAYLEAGFRNDVTSAGTPIGATARLNALKFWVTLALLHHGTNHPRWSRMLQRLGSRNLAQIRMDPDFEMPSLTRALAGADPARTVFDETVWLPQLPDNPANGLSTCPECQGTGDLRSAIGTFADTREMRPYRATVL